MGEGPVCAAFGTVLVEGDWAFLWVSRRGGLLRQASVFPQIVQHLNKDLFPFLPTSASRICLLVPGGSQSPTLVQQHYHNFPVTILAFSRLQSKIFA